MEKIKHLRNGQAVRLIQIAENPDWLDRAAGWFHEKWHIPEAAYRESMEENIQNPGGVPWWYLVLDEAENIIGGGGVIENDFHARKDLRPNFCALYVEKPWRGQGIARLLLDAGREDAGRRGISRLYLITDHEDFYERCGWRFLTMVDCDGGEVSRMYEAEAVLPRT